MSARLMIATLLLSLSVPFSPVMAEEDEKPAAEPTEHLAMLADGLKERKSNDDDKRHEAETKIVEAIDLLLLDFKSYDPKAQKKVCGSIAKLFKVRAKEDEDRIYIAAAAFMSDCGPLGEDPLKKAMKVKHLEKRLDVQVMLIESLGKHRNPKNADMFIKLLKESEVKTVVAAIHALSEYRDEDPKVRKNVAEALVKQYANAHNLDSKERGRNPVWRERLLGIEVPMNDALGALTLQNFQTAPEWEKWYNDNRSKKW